MLRSRSRDQSRMRPSTTKTGMSGWSMDANGYISETARVPFGATDRPARLAQLTVGVLASVRTSTGWISRNNETHGTKWGVIRPTPCMKKAAAEFTSFRLWVAAAQPNNPHPALMAQLQTQTQHGGVQTGSPIKWCSIWFPLNQAEERTLKKAHLHIRVENCSRAIVELKRSAHLILLQATTKHRRFYIASSSSSPNYSHHVQGPSPSQSWSNLLKH